MMKTKARCILMVSFAVSLCLGVFLCFQTEPEAKSVTALEGAKFDTAASLADNLKIFAGKDVIIHLRSGKTLQGYVRSVGNGLLHLEKLAARDFYDALVRMEDISAMEAKFRDLK